MDLGKALLDWTAMTVKGEKYSLPCCSQPPSSSIPLRAVQFEQSLQKVWEVLLKFIWCV